MTRPTLRRALPAVAILLALGLAGCTLGAPTPDVDAAASASPRHTPSASAEPTPEPTAPSGIPTTCENVMTAEAYTRMQADGLEPTPSTPFDPIEIRIVDEGGLSCAWGKPQTDFVLAVSQVPVGDDEYAWTGALAEAGYTRTDDPVPGAYTGLPDAGNGITPVAIVADGTVTFVSLPAFAAWMTPAS